MILSLDRPNTVFDGRGNCKENIFAGCGPLQLGVSDVGKRGTRQNPPD
jgi:hypothetical protein